MLVQVNTKNGIYEVNNLSDFNSPEILKEADFLQALACLDTSEEYGAELSDAAVETLEQEYGIKRLPKDGSVKKDSQ